MIYLVRHGETSANVEKIIVGKSNEKLSNSGKIQSSVLANYFIHKSITKIVSSSELRAIETAEIIEDKLKCEFIISNYLVERDYGVLDGMKRDILIKWRRDRNLSNIDPTQDWISVPEVESDESIYNRVYPLLNEQLKMNSNTVFITHAGVIKSIIYRILKIPFNRYLAFKFPNASIVSLRNNQNITEIISIIPHEELLIGR